MSEINFIKENLSGTPPCNCSFKVGDRVNYTNDYGIEFIDKLVIGFAKEIHIPGRFIHLSGNASPYWMPVSPDSLTLVKSKPTDGYFF